MKKSFIFVGIILCNLSTIAQDRIFITGEIEGGLLTTNYKTLEGNTLSIINGEESNHNIKLGASVLLEWNNKLSFEVGIAQNMNLWSLEGKKPESSLEIKNRQLYPSAFIGGYYDIPFYADDTNLQFYLGSRFGIEFQNYNSINGKDGTDTEYVVAVTEKSLKYAFKIIPEIGIKGRFKNDNIWRVGLKYYHPLNGDIINGQIKHYQNGKMTENINFNATGQIFALSFNYGFSI